MQKRKVLLLTPPLSLEERYAGLRAAGNTLPSLGLCYLAAIALRKKWKVRILDLAVLGIGLREVISEMAKETPQLVGMTAPTPAVNKVAILIREIKSRFPQVVTLLGGPHISALPEETMQDISSLDIGVIGEGEATFKEILEFMEGKKSLNEIKGIIYRKNGKIFKNIPREPIWDLDSLPFPAWELLPSLSKYYRPSLHCIRKLPATILVTSRGCPYQCAFCDHSVFGYKIRYHSPSYVVDMMNYLYLRYGIKEFALHDECLLVDKTRAVEMCEKILKKGKGKFSWTVQARADQIEPNLLSVFKKSGCWQIQLGIESGSEKILQILKKGVSKAQIEEACQLIKKAGLQLKGFFMLANPGETLKSITETMRFIHDLPLDDFQLTFFTPYPGSPIFGEIEKWGTLISKNYFKMNEYQLVFLPRGLDPEMLNIEFKKFYRRFYLRPRVVLKYTVRMLEPSVWKVYLNGLFGFLRFLLR